MSSVFKIWLNNYSKFAETLDKPFRVTLLLKSGVLIEGYLVNFLSENERVKVEVEEKNSTQQNLVHQNSPDEKETDQSKPTDVFEIEVAVIKNAIVTMPHERNTYAKVFVNAEDVSLFMPDWKKVPEILNEKSLP